MRGVFAATLRAAALVGTALLSACMSSGGVPPVVAVAPESSAPTFSRGDAALNALIAHHAEANGVPLVLAHAVVEKESGYNAGARGRGTVGLMQIKPATARGIGYRGTAAGLYDPDTNLAWGMKYLGGAWRLGGGDLCGALLRYQGGHRATRHSAASRKYCAQVKAIMARNGSGEAAERRMAAARD